MTIDQAVGTIREAYNRGERRIMVSPEVFGAYKEYCITISRMMHRQGAHGLQKTPTWLAFKNAWVMEEAGVTTCEKCGAELHQGDWPFCPHGRTGNYTNFRDEYPGGITLENYGAQPVTFYTESERRAYLREHGLEQKEKWCPFPGTDRDPAGVQDGRKYQDPQTLENGKILMLRAAGCRVDDSAEVTGVLGRTFSGHLTGRDAKAVASGDKIRSSRVGRRLMK